MKTVITLDVLVEVMECLRIARENAAPGTYGRLLGASSRLAVCINPMLLAQEIAVAADDAEFAALRSTLQTEGEMA